MRRKRIVAKLLALSLLISGLPMTSAYAAELPEPTEVVEQEADEVEGEETTAEDSAVEDTDEKETDAAENDASAGQEEAQDENAVTDEAQQDDPEEAETTETTDAAEESSLNGKEKAIKELKVAENAKMAGSNGILYDGVTYLSARNVLAMDEKAQAVYRSLCDDIAAAKEGGLKIENVVFAVDANGDIYCSYDIPSVVLDEIQADMLPDVEGTLTPDTEESLAEEKKGDETSEDGKDAVEEEKKDDETSENGKDAVDEEKKDDETSEDGKDVVDEEKKDDETSEDGKDAVDETETSEDAVEEEEQTAEEESDELELFEENLDLIPEMEEETFEEIESVRIENTLDLGYGSGVSDGSVRSGIQFNSVLPNEDYFYGQLTARQQKYYNAAKGKLTKGSNKITFTDSFNEKNPAVTNAISDDVAHAVSALVLDYPDKTDWMAKPGTLSVGGKYRPGTGVANYVYTVAKSKYYSGSLDSKAKKQVETVGNLALQYAAENCSETPVYGIVKYFDQWVCENGFYDNVGLLPFNGNATHDKLVLEINGLDSRQLSYYQKRYYQCHSAYGILLDGNGVCESYAKTMSRLMDAVGIPNVYVVGCTDLSKKETTGHAWNYVQMPNGSWYLLDSTWNDDDSGFTDPRDHITSTGTYLLTKGDTSHNASGATYIGEPDFSFKDFPLAGSKYTGNSSAESVSLNKSTLNLVPKGKEQLTCTITTNAPYGKVSGLWSSSNTKVATVDKNGNVTAKAAGTAVITVAAAGMTAQCTVNVDQIKAVKTTDNKASTSISLATTAPQNSKTITLNVDMGASPHKAQWMISEGKATAPVVTSSKADVVKATAAVTNNAITVTVNALKDGNSKVTVKFGGKTVTINVSVGTLITAAMFDVSWAGEATGSTEGNRQYVYTGKAIKPTVKKKTDEAYKPVTFKTTYVNNVNAGSAKVVITGSGKYGGVVEYPFTITKIDITDAEFTKELKSKPYNGGDNPPATVVKLGKKTLKANKDYEILYNGAKPSGALAIGKYTVSIQGIGNYSGTVKTTLPYEVTTNTIAKVTVSGSASAKYTGLKMNPFTVKIGKNVLPASDYTITWYQGQGKSISSTPMSTDARPVAKGKYTAVITVKGSNLTVAPKKVKIEKKFTIK